MLVRSLVISLGLLTGCVAPTGAPYTGPTSLPEIRAASGLSPLRRDADLEMAAREQADLMAGSGRMSHATGSTRSFRNRMRGAPTNGGAAENIAHGAFGQDELFRRWMASPGHRRNMLNPDYTRYGLASAADPRDPRRKYWALVLAR